MSETLPSPKLLLTELTTVTHWEEVGVHLGLESSEIERIEWECCRDMRRCKLKMFILWIKKYPNVTWEKVIKALMASQYNELAARLQLKYIPELHAQSPTPPHDSSSRDDQGSNSDVVEEKEIQVSIRTKIASKFDEIENEFVLLISDTEKTLEVEEVTVGRMKRHCKAYFPQLSLTEVDSIEKFFDEVNPYYSFLKITFLAKIIKTFLKHTVILDHLKEYDEHLEEFKSSTTLQEFIEEIERAHKPSTPEGHGLCRVTIRLVGGWLDKTVKNLEELMKEIFKDKSSVLDHLHIVSGSVVVTYLAPQSEAGLLINLANRETDFISCVGVCELQVGKIAVKINRRDVLVSFDYSLIQAVKKKDLKVLSFLLELNTSPDVVDEDEDWTVLMVASYNGSAAVASLLLKAKANPNLQRRNGTTALYLASQNGHSAVVSLLLKAITNPDLQSNNGATAMWIASQAGHTEIVNLLLHAHAKYDVRDNSGGNVLHVASLYEHPDIVHLLLTAGADPNVQQADGTSALYLALSKKNMEIATLLLAKGANPNQLIFDETVLHMAIRTGNFNMASLLLKANANPNVQNSKNVTALHIATQEGRAKLVDLLLKSNSNPDLKSHHGATALHLASGCGYTEIVDLLLRANANPNLHTKIGATALHAASECGNAEIVSMLLKRNVNPNLQTIASGETALHLASQNGHSKVVDLLLAADINPDIQRGDGVTALYLASQEGHDQVVELLLKAKAQVNIRGDLGSTALYAASQNGHTAVVLMLLLAKADPNLQSNIGATALHLASQEGNCEIVRLLLEANAKPDLQANSGAAAIHLAIQQQHSDVVKLLLDANANPNLESDGGLTGLYIASQNSNLDIVSLLLHAKANPNSIVDENGITALMVACYNGNSEITELLLSFGADPNMQDSSRRNCFAIATSAGHDLIADLLQKTSRAKVSQSVADPDQPESSRIEKPKTLTEKQRLRTYKNTQASTESRKVPLAKQFEKIGVNLAAFVKYLTKSDLA